MIIFSEHAKQQNERRKIPVEFIYQAIDDPDQELPSYKDRKLVQKSFGDKILEVVIVKENDTIIVITQYYLDR